MDIKLSHHEFLLFQKYIREQCGILISQDKAYLIESRLAKILAESGAKNFLNLYHKLCSHPNQEETAQKVFDAITTQETQWFRDRTPWLTLEEILLPAYIREIREGTRSRVRIWSAACATGQEPYSTVMCIDNYLTRYGIDDVTLSHFEILATDISKTALRTAETARYDSISMTRGLSEPYKARYFRQVRQGWLLDERIKKTVKFRHFNLRESFLSLGRFDIVLCRYVIIYFYEEFKKELLAKMAAALTPRGVLFLGSSEIFSGHMKSFELKQHKGGSYYCAKG